MSLEKIRGGDPTALAQVFAEHRAKLKQMVAVRMGPQLTARVDPSDVLQDAYLDAVRNVQRYLEHPKVSVFVWLRGITRDRLLKTQRQHLGVEQRAAQREVCLPEQSSVALGSFLMARGRSPSATLMHAELRDRVQQAITELSPNDREVILLRHFEGLSNKEVAEVLDISASGATMRHGRALIKLKEILEREVSCDE